MSQISTQCMLQMLLGKSQSYSNVSFTSIILNFGPKAPTPTALKQPTHTQKSTHQQCSVSCVNLKKKLLVKNENTKTCEHLCCQMLKIITTFSYCTHKVGILGMLLPGVVLEGPRELVMVFVQYYNTVDNNYYCFYNESYQHLFTFGSQK